MELVSIGTPLLWTGFIAFVLAMLALDLFVFGGDKAHKVSVRSGSSTRIPRLTMAEKLRILQKVALNFLSLNRYAH